MDLIKALKQRVALTMPLTPQSTVQDSNQTQSNVMQSHDLADADNVSQFITKFETTSAKDRAYAIADVENEDEQSQPFSIKKAN